jgi:hypothetical protein
MYEGERKIHAEYCGCHTLILYADMNMFHKCETKKEKKSKYFLQFQHQGKKQVPFFKCKS